MPASQPSAEIEVGASHSAGDLRYWKAREAVRQGEARLVAQAAIRTAMEARATAITGWAAASLVVATGAVVAAPGWASRSAVGLMAGILFLAAGLCIYAARPRDWSMAGYDPAVVTSNMLDTELELLEAIAGGITPGLQDNIRRLDGMGRLLRWAGWLLIAAPLAGGLAYSGIVATTWR